MHHLEGAASGLRHGRRRAGGRSEPWWRCPHRRPPHRARRGPVTREGSRRRERSVGRHLLPAAPSKPATGSRAGGAQEQCPPRHRARAVPCSRNPSQQLVVTVRSGSTACAWALAASRWPVPAAVWDPGRRGRRNPAAACLRRACTVEVEAQSCALQSLATAALDRCDPSTPTMSRLLCDRCSTELLGRVPPLCSRSGRKARNMRFAS